MSIEDINDNLELLNSFQFGKDFFLGMTSLLQGGQNKNKQSAASSIKNLPFTTTEESTYETELEKHLQDIALIKESGIQNYRFSLSWSRILPNGKEEINSKALAFYNAILDNCTENGIEPFVTLYDANLPAELNKNKDWSNRDILNCFQNYVEICLQAFKDKVNYWIIFNEPSVFTGAYDFFETGFIGKEKVSVFLSSLHHALLSQSIGYKTIKQIAPDAHVGSFFSCNYSIPMSFTNKDLKTADRVDALLNRIFIEPSLGMGYPIETLPFLKSISKYVLPEDEALIKVDFDFIGIQNYTREIVSYNLYRPYLNAKILEYDKLRVKKNHLGLEIYNELVYLIIKKYSDYQGVKKIFITDNLTLIDEPTDMNSAIGFKKAYNFQSFLKQIQTANQSGGKVGGYFLAPN